MRRSTSRIGKLPPGVLEAVNERLYKGWEYPQVREWLFEQVAEEDVPALGLLKGEKFSQVWLRSATSPANAAHFCQLALGTWYRSRHPQWVREKVLRGEAMKVVKRAGVLTREVGVLTGGNRENRGGEARGGAGSDADLTGGNRGNGGGTEDEVSIEGGDILMRSILIDAISQVTNASAAAPGAMPDSSTARGGLGGGGYDRREVAQLANAWARLKAGKMEEEKLRLKTEDSRKAAFDQLGKEIKDNPEALELFYKLRDVMDGKKAEGLTGGNRENGGGSGE